MYSYTFDKETGGLILNSTPTVFSKEPRPVFAPEMNLLGFDRYWNYDKDSLHPIMWAESNAYWYRGVCIAKAKGGDLYCCPELIPVQGEDGQIPFGKDNGESLTPIDIETMCAKNIPLMAVLEDATVKKIIRIYEKYKNKLDIFHVAFSGGKDSAVLLDLVKRALPQDSFVVIFGDTGMEFPDTYDAVEHTSQMCEQEGIVFYATKSHFNPHDSWKAFGPPARVLRWCCSVHKSTPQTLKMREITGKNDYVGMDFVGVRAHESTARSKYEYENFGKKQKGQYSHNPILEWTSAEIWLYMFMHKLYINKTYTKGNSRAGCLLCPKGGGSSDYFRHRAYANEIDEYIEMIKDSYDNEDSNQIETYFLNGGWNARNNGRSLKNNPNKCIVDTIGNECIITCLNTTTTWSEWIKTLGTLYSQNDGYEISFKDRIFPFKIKNCDNGFKVIISQEILKDNPEFSRVFKQVFYKSTYCAGCKVCETNCRFGCISFRDNRLTIENCRHCLQCHNIDSGCLLYHSLRHPQGGGRSMKSLNSFADHAPKTEWLSSYFDLKDNFFTEHTLGPMMYDMFRRFLRDAGLNDKNHFTAFAELVVQLGWDTPEALGLILTNLAYENPQIEWYITNLDINQYYSRESVTQMLVNRDVKVKDANSIVKAYKRIVNTPIGTTLNFGYVSEDDELVRTKCAIPDSRVLLYALYKFNQKCNLSGEFSVYSLYDEEVERDGLSPVRIFGLYDEDELRAILKGLSAKYPEFINATFTNDLQSIILRDKTPEEVLKLFVED